MAHRADGTGGTAALDLHEGIDARGSESRVSRPLDLHEGSSHSGARDGCARWPEHLRLLNETTGELVPGRCRATNLCRYCQALYVVETVEMLTLDAVEYAPTLWVVLTAREHLTRAECRRHLDHVLRRALRAAWPDVQWFVQVEFQRRGALHLNLLVKGVPVAQLDEFREAIVTAWCARVDAEPVGQWAGVVEDGVGVVRYISKMLAHGLKREQAPPIGWRGHRTSQTRGYLVRPASVMREEAKRSLRLKRLVHRLGDAAAAEVALGRAELETWSLRAEFSVGVDRARALREDARRPFKLGPVGVREGRPVACDGGALPSGGTIPSTGPHQVGDPPIPVALSLSARVDTG